MPFVHAKTYDPERDIPDLTGKVALVSGGNTGIGLYTVAELLKHGVKVYLGSRSESRATGAIAQLRAEGYLDGTKGRVIWLPLDISTPASARAGAEEFSRRETRLDILVNNAGLGGSPSGFPVVNAEIPISAVMCTNHLGTFTLTTALLPLLMKTAQEPGTDVRIVTVASSSHYFAKKIDWKSTKDWVFPSGSLNNNISYYGVSKLANILFVKELQRKLDEQGSSVISISVHPGEIETAMTVEFFGSWGLGRFLNWVFHLLSWYLSPQEGAFNSLFAATSPVVRAKKSTYAGAYLNPFGVLKEPSPEAKDPVAARDLWETSERTISEM
ncbi:hypothetical protein FRB96_005160 [Tulasnella sp. 330]|nr:hypothetical protein FRB96_005160 [Tulasnella sp. 330]